MTRPRDADASRPGVSAVPAAPRAEREIVAATGNPHKLEEIRAVLEPLGVRVLSLAEAGDAGGEPDETGATFRENAAIKARDYAARLGRVVLADDSGLEVDALDGEPGVHSAHWAGREGSRADRDARNNERLLRALVGVPSERRTARFICALCMADANGVILLEAMGAVEGVIADAPRGAHGFGYDPLFVVRGLGRTSAELSAGEKNEISHRGRALRDFAQRWSERVSLPG
ncbi:MAG: RdgB/HAM1 family non-canonical purine NTP pyrophosphatase [Phycisphaeraceae bacterium]|nr:RdgB/HAM1 family non-canonical purine NTP pyrophosphatase [Phycisphaeraceae bacterium]